MLNRASTIQLTSDIMYKYIFQEIGIHGEDVVRVQSIKLHLFTFFIIKC